MSPSLKRSFEHELSLSDSAASQGKWKKAFSHLERAHILGQKHFIPHLRTHWKMLHWGIKQRHGREIFGQTLRLIAVFPGNMFGWLPTGNTGGANVPAFRKMAIEADLQEILRESESDG